MYQLPGRDEVISPDSVLFSTGNCTNVEGTKTVQTLKSKLQRLHQLFNNPWAGAIDYPTSTGPLTAELRVAGWVISWAAPVSRVEISLDQLKLGPADYGLSRPDVSAAQPWYNLTNCGYAATFKLDPASLGHGPKLLQVCVTDQKGHNHVFEQPIRLIEPDPRSTVGSPDDYTYEDWLRQHEPDEADLKNQPFLAAKWAYQPLISLLTPVYNPPLAVLQAAIASVLGQTYANWELWLVDGNSPSPQIKAYLDELAGGNDSRIRVVRLSQNLGIAANSNRALELAQGEFCGLLDHDDTLAPDALYQVALALNQNPALDFLYSDHDLLTEDGRRRFNPLFKPDWSPEIMLSANYVTHLTVIRTNRLHEAGGFKPGTDGAQDWDLFFRVLEKTGPDRIKHLPRLLYHWRVSATSTATNIAQKPQAPANQLKAIETHLQRSGLSGARAFFDSSGFLRVSWPVAGQPLVSIIVPTRDKPELITRCVRSVLEKTAYPHFELLIVDTGSQDTSVLAFYNELNHEERVRLLYYTEPFNYSAVNNWAARQAQGQYLLFLNNDTEVITNDWLEEMLRWAQRPECGLVGAKLLRPDNNIQHAGVIVGLGGFAGHIFAGLPEAANTPYGFAEWYRNYLAVTAACMMMRRSVFEELGGFNEEFSLNGGDVELGLRAWERRYRVVYNPFARLYHLENATHQGKSQPADDYRLSQKSYAYWLKHGDPYFNPNLSYWHTTPSLANLAEPSPYQFAQEFVAGLEGEQADRASLEKLLPAQPPQPDLLNSLSPASPAPAFQSELEELKTAYRQNLTQLNQLEATLANSGYLLKILALRLALYLRWKGLTQISRPK